MTLRTLLLLSATGMVATGATVWATIDPASGSARTAPPTPDRGAARPPPRPTVDRSTFQAGKTLMVEGRLGHRVLPADTDSETFLMVDVSAANATARTPAPLNLAIAIDRSGSMKGKRMANAFAAARTAIQRLRDGDVVSVVAFNTMVDVTIAPTVIDTMSRARILRQLMQPKTTGDTCISCGVDHAMRLVGQRPGMVSRILLLSDGAATAGVRDVPGMKRIAEDCRAMGASITTIGVDVSFDEKLMAALARSSNGHHFFVDRADGLPAIFDREMESLTRTVANGAELAIDFSPGVFATHVYDRATVGSGSQLTVPLGAFSAQERKTVLVRVRVPAGQAGERPIAAVRLRYDDLAEAKPGTCDGALAAQLSADSSALSPLDAVVSARVSASDTAETLETANALFKAGRADDAHAALREGAVRLDRMRHEAARAASTDPKAAATSSTMFQAQQTTLSGAGSGFMAAPAAGAAPDPADKRKGDEQVRRNQAEAFDLSN